MRRRTSAKNRYDQITNRWSPTFGASWDVFMPFRLDDAQYFLCYDNESGTLHCGKPSNSAGFRVSWPEVSATPPFPSGLTAFVPLAGQPYFFYQQPDSATTTLVQLSQPKQNKIAAAAWPIDLPANATLTPLMFEDKPYVFSYDGGPGTLTLFAISLNDHTAEALDTHDWGTGWTAFAALPDENCVLAYNQASGTLRACVLSENGAVPKITCYETQELGAGWSQLAPVIDNSGPTFLVYAAESRTAPKIYAIDQFSPTLILNEKAAENWPVDMSGIMPFALSMVGPEEYYLIHQRFTTVSQGIGGTLLTIYSGSKPGYPDD